jgi:hypothetical protein
MLIAVGPHLVELQDTIYIVLVTIRVFTIVVETAATSEDLAYPQLQGIYSFQQSRSNIIYKL